MAGRNGVQIVAETNRRDVVERHLDVVGGEVAQRRGHEAHQPVEHDLQHGQALIGDQRTVENGLNARLFRAIFVLVVESEQAVDFVLVEDAGGFAPGVATILAADHGLPFGGEIILVFVALTPFGVLRRGFRLGGRGVLGLFVGGSGHGIGFPGPTGPAFP
jgi:hypothetical protein